MIFDESVVANYCKSPIESKFAAAFLRMLNQEEENWGLSDHQGGFVVSFNEMPDVQAFTILMHMATNVIVFQAPIGRYRVDLLIKRMSYDVDLNGSDGGREVMRKRPPVVIECDGHDYHERTKEQAQHDKERDRFLNAEGYRVLRFTGSEIWKDADKCAEEAYLFLSSL